MAGSFPTIPVASASAEQLLPYTTLRRRKDLERAARFVAEGDSVVERLLASAHPVESILLTQDRLERVQRLLEAGRRESVLLLVAEDRQEAERLVGFSSRGLKAVGRLARTASLDAVLAGAPRPWLFAALDGVTNAENVGVVVRNAAALGVQALIVGPTTCSPLLTRAIRTSMGAVFELPCVEDLSLADALGRLRAAGVRSVAAHPAARERTPARTDLRGDTCIVLGSEGEGLSPAVLAACDAAAALPMALGVDSLNVANAAAIFFYEAQRQRTAARALGPRPPATS